MKKKFIIAILAVVLILFGVIAVYVVKEYKDKVEEEKRIETGRIAVEKAIESKVEQDISYAKEKVALIESIDIKNELNVSINNLEIDIEKENIRAEYTGMLDNVESNLNRNELNLAIEKINTIEYEDIKLSLLERTNSIQTLITQKEEKEKAEKKRQEQIAYYNKMKNIDAKPVISTPPSNVTVLETLNGAITAFTPYCSDGCQGYTASGKFIGNGDIYQYDSEYGMVRIVAGDSSYPFGTIVRIRNLNYFGGDIYAMVLDRGGAIGKGRRALFDVLFATEENANRFGVAYNVTCEILRIGY